MDKSIHTCKSWCLFKLVRPAPLIGENPECAVLCSSSIHMSPYLRRWRGSKSLIVIRGRHCIANPISAQQPRIDLERCLPRHLLSVHSPETGKQTLETAKRLIGFALKGSRRWRSHCSGRISPLGASQGINTYRVRAVPTCTDAVSQSIRIGLWNTSLIVDLNWRKPILSDLCSCMSRCCARDRLHASFSPSQRSFRGGNSLTIPQTRAPKAQIKLHTVHGYAWDSIAQ